jgi:hypothetical protein
MKLTLHLVLSSALLLTACSREPESNNPAPTTPPTQEQPKPDAPKVPPASAPTPAENTTPVAPPAIADLGKILGTIKDGPTAEAAKPKLDALVHQLQTAKAAVPAAAKDSLGGLGKLATDAAAKIGVGPEVMSQITALLQNPSVKAAIGPTLEKLQGLLK